MDQGKGHLLSFKNLADNVIPSLEVAVSCLRHGKENSPNLKDLSG